jgi:hypothetical protein
VFRAATSETIDRLRRAAEGTDRELDAALSDLGILPPADLEPIRRCLVDRSAVIVAGTNRDGHRRLEIRDRWGTVAWIDHDGQVALVRGQPMAAP